MTIHFPDHGPISWAINSSWQATVIVVLVVIARQIFGPLMTARWRHALWVVVLSRLLLPVLPQSRLSVFNLQDVFEKKSVAVVALPTPAPHSAEEYSFTSVNLPNENHAIEPGLTATIPPTPVGPVLLARSPAGNACWTVLTIAWLGVAGLLILRLVVINWRFDRRIRGQSVAVEPRFKVLLDSAGTQMKMRRRPSLVVTAAVAAPAVAGVFRPRILLPVDAGSIDDEQLRLVFLHELSHVKCFDVLTDWVWAIVQSVHWFNPALWLVWPLRRTDREMARDEMVLSRVGVDQTESYGRTLLQLARPLGLPVLCPGLVGLFGRKYDLRRRVAFISTYRPRRPIGTVVGFLVVGIVGCGSLTSPKPAAPAPIVATPSATPTFSSPAQAVDPDEPTPAQKAIVDKLGQPVSVDLTGMTLEHAIDTVLRPLDVNVYVDWPALERAKIRPDAMVRCKMRNVKASKALAQIFKSVEGETDDGKLGYAIDEGVLTITTQKELEKNVVTRRYDINDLLFGPPDYSNAPGLVSGGTTQLPAGEPTREARIAAVKRFVMENVAPASWKDHGGTSGAITSSPLRAILLITATSENHKRIASVLDSLRAGMTVQISLEMRVISFAPARLEAVPEKLRTKLATTGDTGGQILVESEVDELLRTAQNGEATSLTLPRLTAFNGQHCELVVSTSQAFNAAYTTVVEGGRTTYQPQQSSVNANGVTEAVMAVATPDHVSVFIDLKSTIEKLIALVPEPAPSIPASTGLLIQRPVAVKLTTRTSVGIPDGATYVIGCGGLTAGSNRTESADVQSAIDTAARSKIFILIRPKILVVPIEPSKSFPLKSDPQ